MYVITVNFTIHPDHVEAFRHRVLQQARDSLEREPGCHHFDVCIDPENPARVFLYELYSDREAFDSHLQSEHFRAFDAEVSGWVADKSVSALALLGD